MGVKGLLKFADSACRSASISKFYGMKFAVDMSCFIHKSLYQDDYMVHLDLYMQRLFATASHVFMVFDGKPPKAKREEIHRRKTAKRTPKFITPEIVFRIVEKYKKYPKASIVFSPAESDAQLAYLANKKFVDVVVTEDSDLIVYGCPLIVYKLKPRGDCVVYQKSFLWLPWDFQTFKKVCVLCGCDYLRAGLPGFGFHRAIKVLSGQKNAICTKNSSDVDMAGHADDNNHTNNEKSDDKKDGDSKNDGNADMWELLAKNRFPITEEFRMAFTAALNAFDEQLVFCLDSKQPIEYRKLVL